MGSFTDEKEIQKATESNLAEIFGLELVKSEMTFDDLRVDTLAYDPEGKSFQIIEYKVERNVSVIDQGYAYLQAVLSKREACLLEYNNLKGSRLKVSDIDWTQTRVKFVSTDYNKYQYKVVGFADMPIELWQVTKYHGGVLEFRKLESLASSGESISKLVKGKAAEKVNKEVKVWTEEDHTGDMPENVVQLYEELKGRILGLSNNVTIRPRQEYIGFVARTNFADVEFQKSQLKLWLNMKKGELNDPANKARDVSDLGHHGNGDYDANLRALDDVDYVMTLVRQSYTKHAM